MASECGWSHDFILDNFTLEQVQEYHRVISQKKLKDLQLMTIATFKATAYAFGGIKKKDFMSFIDSLDQKEKIIDVHKSVDDMKKQGLPVEDK